MTNIVPLRRNSSTRPDPICDELLESFIKRVRAMSSAGYKPTGAIMSPDWSTQAHNQHDHHQGASRYGVRGGNQSRYDKGGR